MNSGKSKWMMAAMAVGLACAMALAAVAQDDGGEKKERPKRGDRGDHQQRPMPAGMILNSLIEGAAAMPDAAAAIQAYQTAAGDSERELMQLRRTIMQAVQEAKKGGKDEAAVKALIEGYKDQLTPLVDKVTEARITLLEALTGVAKANPVDVAAATTTQMLQQFERMASGGGRRGGRGQGEGRGNRGDRGKGGNGGNRGGGNKGGGNEDAAPAVTF